MSVVVVGAVLLGLLGVVLCAGVWIGMSLGIVGWIGLAGLYRYIAGPQSVHRILGYQRFVGACGAAAVHLDGRDSVPDTLVRADVRGTRAVAATYSRSFDARQHPGLRHLRLGVRLVRSDVRNDRESRLARASTTRIRRTNCAGLARDCRHAWHPDSTVDHDGRVCGGGRRLDHSRISGGDHAGRAADGALLRIHRRLGADEPGAHAKRRRAAALCRKKCAARAS